MRACVVLLVYFLIATVSCKSSEKNKEVNRPVSAHTEKATNQRQMRKLEELIDKNEPGFELVQEWIKDSKNTIEILSKNQSKAESALFNTQVTTHSPMGAIIYETGGILVNSGWLRILGSGHPRLDRSLPEWNKGKSLDEYGEQPSFLLIADDVLGGFFAINGGGLSDADLGKVFYFAPDTMEWESTDKGYSDFIYWCFHGDLDLYYKGFFWEGFETDLKQLSGTQAVSFFPYLWTKEGQDINACDRKIVPIEEIWNFHFKKKTD